VILDLIAWRVWGKIVENVTETVKEVPIELSPEELKKQKPDPKAKGSKQAAAQPLVEWIVEKHVTLSFEIIHNEISFK